MNKPWYKSLTLIGAIGVAAIQTLEQQAVIPEGATKTVADFGQTLLALLSVFGLRRAVGPQ